MKLTYALKARHTAAPIPGSLTERLAKMAELSDTKRSKKTLHRRRFIALAATSLVGVTLAATGPHIPYVLQLRAAAEATSKVKAVKIITEVYSPEMGAWRTLGETYEANGHEFRTGGFYTHFTTPTQEWRGYPDWDLAVVEPNRHYGGVGTSGMGGLLRSLVQTPWTALLPFISLFGDEDATTRTVRLEYKTPFSNPESPSRRSVWVIEKTTNRVQAQYQEMRYPGQDWQARSRQRFVYDSIEQPADFPKNDVLVAGRVIDLSKARAAWLAAHQKPLVEQDGVQLLDLQRNQQGDLFVILDAGKGAMRCDITAARDSLGTVYPNQYMREINDWFQPSTGMAGINGQIEWWSGFERDGHGLFGGWFIPIEPSNAARTVTLTVQVMGIKNLTTTLTLELPEVACEDVPEHMPLLSTFPHSPTELARTRATIRATYHVALKHWPEALTQLDTVRELAPEKTESDARWWFQRAEVLAGLEHHQEAEVARERAKAAPNGHVNILHPGGKVERK
ncbi:MAG: hypothetical protein NTX57_10205 [Armatimonadetes bacterium]|nr:hypothetical protein [Armatimonadota bacterium]